MKVSHRFALVSQLFSLFAHSNFSCGLCFMQMMHRFYRSLVFAAHFSNPKASREKVLISISVSSQPNAKSACLPDCSPKLVISTISHLAVLISPFHVWMNQYLHFRLSLSFLIERGWQFQVKLWRTCLRACVNDVKRLDFMTKSQNHLKNRHWLKITFLIDGTGR